MFNLEQQRKIEKSKIRSIFTPGMPAKDEVQFSGREKEISRAITSLLRAGEHVLIYGDRGVGKTSLSEKVGSQFTSLKTAPVLKYTCGSNTSLSQLLKPVFELLSINVEETSITTKHNEGLGAKVSAGFASADVGSRRVKSVVTDVRVENISASELAKKLVEHEGLYVVDEFDNISDKTVVYEFSEFIKILSDSGIPFKIMIVGVAESSRELVAGHPSVKRCLKEIHVDKLSDKDIADIVVRGAERAKIRISNLATSSIVSLSDGYPYFTHLIALQCCEHAIANDIGSVEHTDILKAIEIISKDASATLSKEFSDSVRSYKTDIYRDVLLSAAKYGYVEFSTSQLRESLKQSVASDYNDAAFTRCLTKLVKDHVFIRISRGHYKFRDPRMSAYLKIYFKDINSISNERS